MAAYGAPGTLTEAVLAAKVETLPANLKRQANLVVVVNVVRDVQRKASAQRQLLAACTTAANLGADRNPAWAASATTTIRAAWPLFNFVFTSVRTPASKVLMVREPAHHTALWDCKGCAR